MKKLISVLIVLANLNAWSQNKPETFTIEKFTKDIRFKNSVDILDTLYTTSYDLNGIVFLPDTSLVDHLVCEFYSLTDDKGNAGHFTLASLPVTMTQISSSAYNQLYTPDYFMESKRLYFLMKSLNVTPDKKFKISAYDSSNVLLKEEIINLDF